MSLCSLSDLVPNGYLICTLNSDLLFDYYREFINCTVNIQINDIRQIPIIVPNKELLSKLIELFHEAVECKKGNLNKSLDDIEKEINLLVGKLYGI